MNGASSPTPRGLKLGHGPPQWLFFAIFTISGFSGLIYESIWSHYLKLFLGHAAYAQSLVLMIFMGGLALGSWLTARYSHKWHLPILLYAVVEGVIGLIALLFHDLFVGVSDGFHFSILPSIESATLGSALKWTAASVLILPQSVLLGMTFPLMSAGIIRRYPDHPGGSLAMLYFTNSIGAAVGVLASGFWLIRLVGLPGTIFTAGILNIALALTVWILVKLDPEPAPAPAEPSRASDAASRDGLATLFFVAAGITGAASFIYEISWLHMLSLVLGSTTHSFELMLSAFISGLAFGGLWIRRRIDRLSNAVRFSGWVQILMGAAAVSTIPLYILTFDWMAAILGALENSDQGYVLFTVMSHAIALFVMVPTTFLAGMTLPLFTHVLMQGQQGERAIGRVYASNTLGAIAGVLFAVHIDLPLLGLKTLICFGAMLDVFLGLVLLHKSQARDQAGGTLGPVVPGLLVGGAALLVVLVGVNLDPKRLASGVYRYGEAELDEQTTAVYYKDGKTASISLIARSGLLTISTNGKPDAAIQMDPLRPGTSDEITMVMAAALPLTYNTEARQIANIGLGSGLTTHTFLADSLVERMDTIEIETAMVEAAEGFGERVARAFSDPRSTIHVEDAKTFFSLANRRYDIIVAEPSNPWVSGVASLFSDEFYRTLQNYLATDGIFVQWLQLYEFNDALAFSVLKALSRNFDDYVVYNTDNTNVLIVAKPNGQLGEPSFDRVSRGELGADLERVGLRGADDFRVRMTGSRAIIEPLLAHSPVPANSDYFPYLDLNAGRARFRTEIAGLFTAWSTANVPILEMLGLAKPEFSRVSANPYFARAETIASAHAGYATMVENVDMTNQMLPPLYQTYSRLRLLGGSCAPRRFETEWTSALHGLAVLTLAYLDAQMGEELFSTISPENCPGTLSESLQSWIALYRAVAARDANQMAAIAEGLLNDDVAEDEPRRHYLLAAAMLGRLAQDDPEEALGIWQTHSRGIDAEPLSPDLQLLVSLALPSGERSTVRAR